MAREITALKVQKRNRERVNVFLDGEFAFGLSRIVAAWLQIGQKVSDEQINDLLAKDAGEVAYQKALKYINYRERSEEEVRRHLTKHDIDETVILQTISRLRRSGLIDDQRFARSWVENRLYFRPRSRRALTYELRFKGISEDTIQIVLDGIDESEMAYQAAVKQSRKYRNTEWPEFRKKMLAFLARRGFTYDITAPIVSRVWEEQNARIPAQNE